jgi:arabinose-5-phosphate isomerase
MAPSTSTTAMLALGDALALTVSQVKNFTREAFARYHPGGKLGLKLMKVSEVMRSGAQVPRVAPATPLRELLIAITRCRSGAGLVVDEAGRLLGIFSDGDLRRCLENQDVENLDIAVEKVMTCQPVTLTEERLATEALHLLKTKRLNQLPVLDATGRLSGLLDVQDLLDIGLV